VGIGLAQDPEKMKSLIAFKKRLEDQLEKLDAETKEVQSSLDTVNEILLEKGFRRGDLKAVPETSVPPPIPKEVVLPKAEPEAPKVVIQRSPEPVKTVAPQQATERETVIPLKTMAEEPLALIIFDKQGMHILPDETKNFSVNTPPFNNFLVEKVFAKMQEKDAELVKIKQLAADKAFSFHVVCEGDLIREIIIRNVDEERLKELKSSIRWTFEKMHEKMKSAQS
jgi:predicted amino acid-binding ACT domain protein